MIISISGQAGSGKSTISKLLAKRLGYKHYSGGDMRRKIARERGLTLAELNKLGETDETTDKEADNSIKKLGETEDNFVIDGRLAFHFIPHSFKILLKADLDTRAKRVYKDKRISEKFEDMEAAKKMLTVRDKSDLYRYEKYYGLNHLEDQNYDLVIETINNPDKTVEKIISVLKEKGLLKN